MRQLMILTNCGVATIALIIYHQRVIYLLRRVKTQAKKIRPNVFFLSQKLEGMMIMSAKNIIFLKFETRQKRKKMGSVSFVK